MGGKDYAGQESRLKTYGGKYLGQGNKVHIGEEHYVGRVNLETGGGGYVGQGSKMESGKIYTDQKSKDRLGEGYVG